MNNCIDKKPHAKTDESPRLATLGERIITLIGVILPFLGLVGAIVYLWGWGLSWVELALLAGMYLLTGLGITVGYHRLFSHQAFETNPAVKFIFAILGSMAFEGPLLTWVATHRRHHQHSDQLHDPHSPHSHGAGWFGVLRGFLYAHLGWFIKSKPGNLSRYVKDLRQSRLLRLANLLFPLWVALGFLIPTVLGYLLLGGWVGAVLGLGWGGLVRMFFVHHVTWSVNSVCHLWGQRPYGCKDESRNNFVVGVLGLGEGWHNNHHAFPASARHGLKWWQIDASYWVIQLLVLLRLAWNVKLPARTALSLR